MRKLLLLVLFLISSCTFQNTRDRVLFSGDVTYFISPSLSPDMSHVAYFRVNASLIEKTHPVLAIGEESGIDRIYSEFDAAFCINDLDGGKEACVDTIILPWERVGEGGNLHVCWEDNQTVKYNSIVYHCQPEGGGCDTVKWASLKSYDTFSSNITQLSLVEEVEDAPQPGCPAYDGGKYQIFSVLNDMYNRVQYLRDIELGNISIYLLDPHAAGYQIPDYILKDYGMTK